MTDDDREAQIRQSYTPDYGGDAIFLLRLLDDLRRQFLECARYDALMEGPRFRGWDRSALDRLRRALEEKATSA